ncbi:hypothetical protein ZOSMA_30G00730 [Zostera marina]|uniref:Uncharacterized protein n=1 Tax=Zostera marina TaxID=29655 RepID=A0A0K9P9P0_ZOSMR|nr:hypothetical protein ZOSMA_30G00730 [Zostera marina]
MEMDVNQIKANLFSFFDSCGEITDIILHEGFFGGRDGGNQGFGNRSYGGRGFRGISRGGGQGFRGIGRGGGRG